MNWLQKMFGAKVKYNGIPLDTRPQEEKNKDWRADEIASAAAMIPVFRMVTELGWKRYTVRNQNGSGSCVAQTVAKMFEVLAKLFHDAVLVFSATPIYQNRANKPQTGMHGWDALAIAVKTGTCRESKLPSQFLNDAQMDALPMPSDFDKLNNDAVVIAYVTLPLSFDYFAAVIEKWGCAMIHVNTDYASWSKDYPTVGGKRNEVVHSITGVDAITFNGKQYIVIEDSWGEFGNYRGQRLLDRAAFNDMVTFGGAFTEFKFEVDDTVHFAVFKSQLSYGQTSKEVVRLQDFLKAKGFFAKNLQSTGYYGNVTARAVYDYQVSRSVAPLAELKSLAGKNVGTRTLAAMNKEL